MQIKEMELVPHDGFSSHAQEAFGWLPTRENGMGELATALHPPHELMFLYDVAFGRWNDNRHTTGHIIKPESTAARRSVCLRSRRNNSSRPPGLRSRSVL